MPKFNTHFGVIEIEPSAHGFRATFNAYPLNDTVDEVGDTEEEALGNLCEQLNTIATEARNSVHEYLKKREADETRTQRLKPAKVAKKGGR